MNTTNQRGGDMKKKSSIKIILIITCVLLLLNLIINLPLKKVSAGAIRRYKVERVITSNNEGAFSQLWIKINEIMGTYQKGSLVSVVKHSSDDEKAVWYLIIRAW